MSIDLLNIKPTTISKDLTNKFICLYGLEKSGKTTFAKEADALILAFEVGYNALSGIHKVDIKSWMDVRKVANQLKKDEVKAIYKTVAFDTIGIAYTLCEQFICAQNGVASIGDIPWGKKPCPLTM